MHRFWPLCWGAAAGSWETGAGSAAAGGLGCGRGVGGMSGPQHLVYWEWLGLGFACW